MLRGNSAVSPLGAWTGLIFKFTDDISETSSVTWGLISELSKWASVKGCGRRIFKIKENKACMAWYNLTGLGLSPTLSLQNAPPKPSATNVEPMQRLRRNPFWTSWTNSSNRSQWCSLPKLPLCSTPFLGTSKGTSRWNRTQLVAKTTPLNDSDVSNRKCASILMI